MKYLAILSPVLVLALAACDNETEAEQKADAAEDRIEQQADASAAQSGNELAALGMTEIQLLDADLVAGDGSDLGDIEQVRRDSTGAVEALLIEVANSNPDRYVLLPIADLQTRPDPDGHGMDVQTTMTAAQISALPEAKLETI